MKRTSTGSTVFDIANQVLLVIFCLTIIYPFWDMFLLSFSDPDTATSLGFRLWNKEWRLDAYRYVVADGQIFTAYANTIFRTVAGTFLSLIVLLLAAYPLSKRELPFRSTITIFFLVPMFFSGGLIPFYLLIRGLGLLNTRAVLVVPTLFSVFSMLIVRNFIMAMDKGLEEAAFIDGASYFYVLIKIMIPLSKPVLATVALWAAVGHWNSWFDAMIFANDRRLIVLQLLLRRLLDIQQRDTELMRAMEQLHQFKVVPLTVRAATILLTIGPIIVVYPFLQRYFIKGIMIGSLKG